MSLFIKLPITVADPSLPVISPDDIGYFTDVELDAYGHWIFDKSSSLGLLDLAQSRPLTLQNDAFPPSYSSKHLTLSDIEGRALLTGLADTATSTDTLCIVVRTKSTDTAITIPFGSLGDAAEARGGSTFFNALVAGRQELMHTYRGTGFGSTASGLYIDPDVWQFVAVSRDFSTSARKLIALVGGQAANTMTNNIGAYLPQTGSIAIGRGYYAPSPSDVIDIAEAIVFDRSLSAAELDALYIRSKSRMSSRGISVV